MIVSESGVGVYGERGELVGALESQLVPAVVVERLGAEHADAARLVLVADAHVQLEAAVFDQTQLDVLVGQALGVEEHGVGLACAKLEDERAVETRLPGRVPSEAIHPGAGRRRRRRRNEAIC